MAATTSSQRQFPWPLRQIFHFTAPGILMILQKKVHPCMESRYQNAALTFLNFDTQVKTFLFLLKRIGHARLD